MRALLTMVGRLAGMVLPIFLGIGVGRLVSPYLPLVTAWVETLGGWAPVAYVGAYVLAVVLMLPAFLLIMAGGAIFGVAKGTVLALAGATVGGRWRSCWGAPCCAGGWRGRWQRTRRCR